MREAILGIGTFAAGSGALPAEVVATDAGGAFASVGVATLGCAVVVGFGAEVDGEGIDGFDAAVEVLEAVVTGVATLGPIFAF